ncbi:PREDICTED: IgGFc-binding protein-like [Calidris pugnax]|uniref:IgGFc-binding protein-like n=1 Tax=Calidris pugnax TaxID=198806 RepID=UPI00071D7B12|nr:PREDICTED: IgGFc-binding protein-like [Calidris pugnax]
MGGFAGGNPPPPEKNWVTVTFTPSGRGGPLTRTLLLGRGDNAGGGDHDDHGDDHGDDLGGDHGDTFTLRLPPTLELVGSRLSKKVVLIRATQDISVVAFNSKSYTSGATTLLPLEMLGHHYYVVTPEDNKKEGLKELAVAAGDTVTTATIKAKGKFYYRGKTYSSGSTIKVTLEPYDTFQLQSSSDLSGSEVKADRPVAVFSGHTCVKVRVGCDHVVEQLLPVASWGRTYLVPPNPWQRVTDVVYVVAAEKTTVTYQKGEVVATKSMKAGEVRKIEVGPISPLYVTSSAPIQVVFFFTGAADSLKRDPFLLNIPPVSTYCTSYRVVGLPGYFNHLLLVARQEEATSTTFNQNPEKTFSWQDIPGTDFSWASVNMRNPEEIQRVDNQRSPFGLLNLGFNSYLGYGFTGLCATTSPPPPLSCEDLSCQEKCQVVDGQPTCIHEAPLTCWATGDSHYRTFDGKTLHLMGTCTYTLTKTCHQDPTIPFFSVEAKNEARGHLGVSHVDTVTVHVYDVTVEATRAENGIVRVNNRRSHLPISLARGKLRLRQKGRSLLIQTHFHLKVLYDWDHHLLVKLPGALSAKVCGLCGNGDPRDDHLAQANLTGDLGWEATNRSQPCWDNCSGGDCGGCPGDEGKKYEGEESCGLMAQRPGPFEGCHHTLDPQVYLKNCVYDLCVNDGLHVLLCRALEAYADDCREEGTAVSDWRTLVNCRE